MASLRGGRVDGRTAILLFLAAEVPAHVRILLPVSLDPGAWMGGANYFHNLLSALVSSPETGFEVVVATNAPDAFAGVARGPVRIAPAPWPPRQTA